MKRNMGSTDRLIRSMIAVVIGVLILAGTLSGLWAWVAGIIAGIFLLTSMFSFCPLYRLLGIHTNHPKNKPMVN